MTKQVTVGRTLQPTLALAVNRVSYRELTGGGAPILSFFFFFLLLLATEGRLFNINIILLLS